MADGQDKSLAEMEAEEEAALLERDEIFLKKWAGWAILGPFIPTVFAVFVIVVGSVVLNTYTGVCGESLDIFVQIAIVIGHFQLLIYSWTFLGDTISVRIPIIEKDWVIMKPYRSLRFLIFYYFIIFIITFCVFTAFGVIMMNPETALCAETTPGLYSFVSFVLAVWWIGFFICMGILIEKKFGGDLKKMYNRLTREATEEEVSERVFRKKFAEFDKEKVGYITREDLPHIIGELGVYIPDEELPDLMTSLDPKQEGNVQLDVLLEWFLRIVSAAAPDEAAIMTEDAKSK
jgi:hypothetical protein